MYLMAKVFDENGHDVEEGSSNVILMRACLCACVCMYACVHVPVDQNSR
jgi:hypothetical protein